MAVSLFGLISSFGCVRYNQRIAASGIKVWGSRFFTWPLLLSGFLDDERWWKRTAGRPDRDTLKQQKTALEQGWGGGTWDAYKEINGPWMTHCHLRSLPTCPVHVRPFQQGSAMKRRCHCPGQSRAQDPAPGLVLTGKCPWTTSFSPRGSIWLCVYRGMGLGDLRNPLQQSVSVNRKWR